MKKNIIILFIIIATSPQLPAMEPEIRPCFFKGIPTDILNLITSYLTFDDVESEKEFIAREKPLSSFPDLFPSIKEKEQYDKKRIMPRLWLQKNKNTTLKQIKYQDDLFLAVYSPNKKICAVTYCSPKAGKVDSLSIVHTKTSQEIYNLYFYPSENKEKYIFHLAVTSSGNVYARIYNKKIDEIIGFQTRVKIKNIQTQAKEYYPMTVNTDSTETIAFNKQGTHLIMHGNKYDQFSNLSVPTHAVIPLITTLENSTVPTKTFSRYCAQKMICKNLMFQYNQ